MGETILFYTKQSYLSHAKYHSHLDIGNANITYELGRLHLAPLAQFIGGAVQSYFEQGYNNQDYQYQPPAEDYRHEKL
jgi:hypothetical protein